MVGFTCVDWLNYQHLYYFWMVVREGTVSAAAERLRLAQPTISAQLRALENSFERKLFEKSGRRLALTEFGELVFEYAEEIFSLGNELLGVAKGLPSERSHRLRVGVVDFLPKLVVSSLLSPVFYIKEPVKLELFDGKPEDLLAHLSVHKLDMVLSDMPLSPHQRVKAHNHILGKSAIGVYGAEELAKKYRGEFPRSLQQAPMILPTKTTMLRRSLDLWFEANAIHPHIVAESEDSAILKIFGQNGLGLFPLPRVIEKAAMDQYRIGYLGELTGVAERFYAITPERKIQHPGVLAITATARKLLSHQDPSPKRSTRSKKKRQ